MKGPTWIANYSPLSSSDGQIESIIVILPPEDETSKIEVYQPLIDELNLPWREVIQFNNDFSQINEFWKDTPETSGNNIAENKNDLSYVSVKNPNNNGNGIAPIPHHNDEESWENTTRTYIPKEDSNDTTGEDESWEGTTRYLRPAHPSFSPDELIHNWQGELKAKKALENRTGRETTMLYSKWIQDPVFCLQKYDGENYDSTLVYSIFQQRLVDFLLPLELAQNHELNLRCHPTRLILEGGNMLFVDDILFVGKDLIRQNLDLLCKREPKTGWTEEKVISCFKAQFNIDRVIPLGQPETRISYSTRGLSESKSMQHRESHQPFFHLDLYLNFGGIHHETGNRIAFVGSPTLALEILDQMMVDDGKGGKKPLGHHQAGKNIVTSVDKIEVLTKKTEMFFDHLKRQLIKEGFTIVEIPLYPFAEPIMQGYAVCSWNNSLSEIYDGGREKHIYLPSYYVKNRTCRTGHNKRIKILEEKVKKIYEDHGFSVHLIDAGRLFRNACQRGGSLHCMVKVLRRKYS